MAKTFGDLLSKSILPDKIDTFKLLGYEPTERQRVFHEASKPESKIFSILYGGAAGGGKAENIHQTLILTPEGFKKFGEVHPGDKIFGRNGEVITITHETPIQILDCYKLTFDDGSVSWVNDEHLWLTYSAKELEQLTRLDPEWRARRKANRASSAKGNKSKTFSEGISQRNSTRDYEYKDLPTGTVRTTAEIIATLKTETGRNNHAVPVCEPLQLPERKFTIDPYLLGAWLGDGFSGKGAICGIDEEIFQNCVGRFEIQSRTMQHGNCHIVLYGGLTSELHKLGLLNNKHIPEEYLMSSYEQRLALLQGLMDTDGNCLTNGSVEFVNTNQNLVEGVAFLARSLGHRVSIRTGVGKLNGKECSPIWKVKFRAKVPLFRLTRKAERLQLDKVRRTQNFRYLVSAEYVGKEEMKCITVDSPDHLYLTSENLIPTHNSCAFLHDAIYNAVNYPGIRIGIFRKSYPELDESFISPLFARWGAVLDPQGPIKARWNGAQHVLRFPNGSAIKFVFAETPKDVTGVQGGEYQIEYIDEGTLMDPVVIQQLQERIRAGTKKVPVFGSRISGNPGGPAHKYLQDRFIRPSNNGKKEKVKERFGLNNSKSRYVAYIPAKVDDNPHLNEDYTDNLDSIPDPQRRKAMRDGDWDARVGQFFMQWQAKRHVVKSFDLPKEWRRYAGIDYGTHNPFAVVWAAIDENGRMWVYREISAAGLNSDVQAKYILSAEHEAGETEVIRSADPAMWGNRGTPYSVADDYGMNGCGIYKADNNRINGWAICHRFLNEAPACNMHKKMGWKTCPMMHVFGDKCPVFCETVPNLMVDPLKPDDADTKGDDHIPDAWRYLCMSVGTFAQPVLYDSLSLDQEEENNLGVDDSKPIVPAKTYDQLFGGNWNSPFREGSYY